MELRYIPPDQLRAVWPRVREGLDEVLAASSEAWWPEDVYHALKTNAAQLFTFGPVAFCVASIDTDQWTGDRLLFLWAAYSEPGAGLSQSSMDQLVEIARKSGCSAVRFGSSRQSFAKHYAIHSITYEVPVE